MKYFYFFIFMLISLQCRNNSVKNSTEIMHFPKKEKVTIPIFLSEKYKNTKFFQFLIEKNKELKTEIFNINDNELENIKYEEKILEKELILAKFLIEDFTEYDFLLKNGKIIFENVISISKTKHYFLYEGWDNDKNKELLEYYEICEAGCLHFQKYLKIFDIEEDSVQLKAELPIIEQNCYNDFSYITTYKYKVTNRNLLTEIIYGRRKDCYSDKIQQIDSVKKQNKTFFNNILIKK